MSFIRFSPIFIETVSTGARVPVSTHCWGSARHVGEVGDSPEVIGCVSESDQLSGGKMLDLLPPSP
jgi:hypothetical protein